MRAVALLCGVITLAACAGPATALRAGSCGTMPTSVPTAGVPTPNVASSAQSTREPVAVVLVWSDCVRPETINVRTGQVVQWQALEAGAEHQLVLEDGTALGQIRKVLEHQFTRPGTYRYHAKDRPSIRGTVAVSGP